MKLKTISDSVSSSNQLMPASVVNVNTHTISTGIDHAGSSFDQGATSGPSLAERLHP